MYDKVKEVDTMNNSYLNNPIYTHYPYSPKYTPHLLAFGETPGFTLISPLFQSITNHPELLDSILGNYLSKSELQQIADLYFGGDLNDSINYIILEIQTNFDHLVFINKNTGEILAEIQLTPENLMKKIEELLPSGSPISILEVNMK